jgi:NADPH:quinone reductase-like Zn-dependent oxidoreductase
MKSIIYDTYGSPDVLKLIKTSIPKPDRNELLIKVISSSVTAADWHLRKADPIMVRFMNGLLTPKKKVLGQEFYGEIVETGRSVTRFKPGDKIFGSTGLKTGAHSEYIIMSEDSVISKADGNIENESLAAIPIGGMTSLFFLKQGGLKKGDRVLINGASGSVGSYAVQIAKAYGASVTGVCSTRNVKLVREIGADQVIDYKKERLDNHPHSYDIVFDTVGNLSYKSVKPLLSSDGHFISTAFNLGLMQAMMMNTFRKGHKVYTGVTKESRELLDEIKNLLKSKKLKAVIERTYSMEEIKEAHIHAESGHKQGNIILAIQGGTTHV